MTVYVPEYTQYIIFAVSIVGNGMKTNLKALQIALRNEECISVYYFSLCKRNGKQ